MLGVIDGAAMAYALSEKVVSLFFLKLLSSSGLDAKRLPFAFGLGVWPAAVRESQLMGEPGAMSVSVTALFISLTGAGPRPTSAEAADPTDRVDRE